MLSAGQDLRQVLPRGGQSALVLPEGRDPLRILAEQHATRLPDLIGVRIGRMLESPFAYYRGSAGSMAADLADAPITGPRVVSCGDAHLSNFGLFASPERALLFDLNDFDEAGIAPWEWDVRRLAASAHVGGRDAGLTEEQCREAAAAAVDGYGRTLRTLMGWTATERYYHRVDAEALVDELTGKARTVARKANAKARRRTSERVLGKIATRDEAGALRIVDEPPVTRHVREHADVDTLRDLFRQYLTTLREDSAYLLSQFRLVDFVLRVVGVGSVGTRCYVIALEGPGGEVLFLQAKEAPPSVLVTYGRQSASIPGHVGPAEPSDGHRVVAGQRILQAQSDPFLGHIIGFAGDQGQHARVDYYWRQFRDMKGSVDLADLDADRLAQYARLCGRVLARAHSQSPQAYAVAEYVGSGDRLPTAVADWAAAYADVCEADFAALERAVTQGRFPVERGV